MLGGSWLLITVLLLIASLLLHQVTLLLVALLFFLAGGIARLWDRYCLSRVEYRRRLSSSRVFFGEEVQLEIEVTNRKPLPLPWVQIDDEIPEELTLLKGKALPSYKAARLLLSNLLPLSWYHRVKRRYHLRCLQRGYFAFGPARIRSGDLFGFFNREMETKDVDYLMVYPRILPLEKLGIPSKQLCGNIRVKNNIFPDPVLTLGVRDYHYGDSLKRIHWKSTARTGQIQTKIFEPTTTVDMGIFLDVRTTELAYWGSVSQLLELGIITAASVSSQALEAGYRVGLYVNQNRWFSHEMVRLAPSQHPDQLRHILEALAPLYPFESMSIDKLLLNEGRDLHWGSTLVVISAVPTDALIATLARMRRAGRRVALILIGGSEAPPSQDGLTVYHVRDDVPWRDIEALHLAG